MTDNTNTNNLDSGLSSQTREALRRLLPSLRTLADTMTRAMTWDMNRGTGKVAAKSYIALHKKVSELLPDDGFITEGLSLEHPMKDEDTQFSVVYMLIRQLTAYLMPMVGENSRHGNKHRHPEEDIEAMFDTSEDDA